MFMFNTLFAGRLNRKQYICRYLATAAISMMAIIAVVATSGIDWESSTETMANVDTVPLYILSIIASLAAFSFDLRRIHDMDLPSQLILLPIITTIAAYIPILNEGFVAYALTIMQLLFTVYLCAGKGTPGHNQYGPQP